MDQAMVANIENGEEEELEDVPEEEKRKDKFYGATIRRQVDGHFFSGFVEEIEVVKDTKERLYRIKYIDGDLEHLTADEMQTWIVKPGDEERAKPPTLVTSPVKVVVKAPAPKGKASPPPKGKAAPAPKGKPGKAAAAPKGKAATPKGKAAAAKPKAKTKGKK